MKRVSTSLPSKYGEFKMIVYEEKEHVALIKGDVENKEKVVVRMHSECMTGDLFGSLRCDCGEQLEKSFELIKKEQNGIVIYLRQEGRGIGLVNKIRAYKLQEQGLDTIEANHLLGFKADEREYGIAAEILKDLNVKSIKLITNNPEKIRELEKKGVMITQRIPLLIPAHKKNVRYLTVKKEKMGHFLVL